MFPRLSSNRLASGATLDRRINYLFLKFMQRAMQHLSFELVQNIDYGVPRTSFVFKIAQELTFSMLTDFRKPEGLASLECRLPEDLASLERAIPWTDLTAFLSQGLDIEARVLSLREQHKDDLDKVVSLVLSHIKAQRKAKLMLASAILEHVKNTGLPVSNSESPLSTLPTTLLHSKADTIDDRLIAHHFNIITAFPQT
ncbi:hypothetical protein V8E52_010587 [Russula decolorans]